MDQSETMNDIVEDWNASWSFAQEKYNVQWRNNLKNVIISVNYL